MPAPVTVEEFLDLARKSQQVDREGLEGFVGQRRQDGNLPAEPRRLAGLLVKAGLVTNFQAEQLLLGKYKGFTLGVYRIIERIGAGGAGMVYLAEHQLMRRRVAIKVLPTHLLDDGGCVERFVREACAASVLDHPNIVH